MKTNIVVVTVLLLVVLVCSVSYSQPRTVGVIVNDTARAWRGYTLLAPKLNTMTYLIDNNGRIVNQWTRCTYPPGQSVYLLPNGHLLRSCMTRGTLSSGGGEGGRIEEYTWGDTLVWSFDYSTANYMSHHDIRPLPNGNVILLAVERKTYAECIAAGFNPARIPEVQTQGYMLPDFVVEVQPTRPTGGTVVWQWHVWDHMIQDFDSQRSNYGTPSAHPELIDCDGDGRNMPVFWNHMNSITYNARWDQILMSVRGNSEIWIIDHSTTTAQAASHTGGRYNHGGDLLYRWGNPVCYGMGTAANQKLYQQHDAEWIDTLFPGAGNITVFNNGLGRNYSSVDEFSPPIDSTGAYTRGASAFGPTNFTWTYTATPPASMYATAISGAQRLPNGNTLVCDGTHGTLTEVTSAGLIVWRYISPVIPTGPVMQGDSIGDDPTHPGEKLNMVFRANRYSPSHPGLVGRTLTPGNYIERYPTDVPSKSGSLPQGCQLSCYPNPFNPTTTLSVTLNKSSWVTLRIYDTIGKEIKVLTNGTLTAGTHRFLLDGKNLASGIYIARLNTGVIDESSKLVLLR